MADVNIKRTIKDSVFCNLFNEPEYQTQFYVLLHPEDPDVSPADFKTVTISNVLTDQLYNDLGFTVRDRLLFLVEAQSTWSVNWWTGAENRVKSKTENFSFLTPVLSGSSYKGPVKIHRSQHMRL